MKLTRIKNAGISVFLAAILFAASGPAVTAADTAEETGSTSSLAVKSADTAEEAETTSGAAAETADTTEAAGTASESGATSEETMEASFEAAAALSESAAQASEAAEALSEATTQAADTASALSEVTTQAADTASALSEATTQAADTASALSEATTQAADTTSALSEATTQAVDTAEALSELTAQAAEAAEALANSEAQVTAAAEAIVESEAQAAEAEAALAAELSLAAGSEPADISSGLYEITSVTSDDFVLDAKSCTVLDTEYDSLQLYDRLDINQQKFYLEELPGSTWRLSVLSSGEAVTFTFTEGASNGSANNSASNSSSQNSSSDSSSGSGSVENVSAAVTGSAALSELIKDAGASARAAQSFTLTDAGDGSYYIQASNGSYLTVDDSFAHRGSSVVLQEYTGRANQRWKLTKTWISATDNADTDLTNPFAEGGIYEDFLLTIKTDAMRDYLTAETVAAWVSISEEEHALVYDEEALTAWVQTLSDVRSTLENGREFTTSLGETITVAAGTYGWSMDVASTASRLLSKIKSGESGSVEAVWSTRGYEYNAQNDISDTYVEVDLTNQKVWLYVDDELLYESDCVSGTYDDPDRHTPEGVYTIYYMASPATLHGADYTSEVQYWMAYYGNFGLHDANWRSEFGGDIYLTDGSHGCVNLPDDMAQIIYENAYIGMLVVTYY